MVGDIPIVLHYKIPEKLPKTAVAFSELAKIEYRDQTARKDGHNDFVASLQTLMNAFDVFFHEAFGKSPTSLKKQPADDNEFTIALLWQIRHFLTHNGGIVDENGKKRYTEIIQKNPDRKMLVELPLRLELDQQISIDEQDYSNARACVLKYIQEHATPEDFHIIKSRGSLVIHQFEGIIPIPILQGHIMVDVATALKYGFKIDIDARTISYPEGTTYNLENACVVLPNGSSFAARYVPGDLPLFDTRKK